MMPGLHASDPPGSELKITTTEDLADLLGDPCPGEFKLLTIRYEVQGWSATLNLDVHDPTLQGAEDNGDELENHVGIVRGKEDDNVKRINKEWEIKKAEKKKEEEARRKAELDKKKNFRFLAREREKEKQAKLAKKLERKSLTMKGMKFSSKSSRVKPT